MRTTTKTNNIMRNDNYNERQLVYFQVGRGRRGAAQVKTQYVNLSQTHKFLTILPSLSRFTMSARKLLFRRIVAVGGRGKRVGKTAEVNMWWIIFRCTLDFYKKS